MKLTVKEIAYIGKSYEEKTPISLFENIHEVTDDTQLKTLVEKGIIVDDSYNYDAQEILNILAKPEKCTRLLVQNDFCIIEKYTYKLGEEVVLVENDNGEMLISKPNDFSSVIINLGEFFGMSKIKTAEFSTSLTSDEMIVLFTIIDCYRKNSILTYVDEKDMPNVISFESILEELNNGFENGLKQIVTKKYNYSIPTIDKIQPLLVNLIEKECLAFEKGYRLTTQYGLFAKNFLIPESLVFFETFEVSNNEIFKEGSFCITAGIHDLLLFIIQETSIEISTISASQMLIIIEEFLNCPDLLENEMPKEKVLEEGQWQCECGQLNTDNFCYICGSKRI